MLFFHPKRTSGEWGEENPRMFDAVKIDDSDKINKCAAIIQAEVFGIER